MGLFGYLLNLFLENEVDDDFDYTDDLDGLDDLDDLDDLDELDSMGDTCNNQDISFTGSKEADFEYYSNEARKNQEWADAYQHEYEEKIDWFKRTGDNTYLREADGRLSKMKSFQTLANDYARKAASYK